MKTKWNNKMREKHILLNPHLRPYQLMCIICRLGRKNSEQYYFENRLNKILGTITKNIHVPVSVVANVDGTFKFQNPGCQYDTPEGKEFNELRDLTILQKIGLMPGSTWPASELFRLIYEKVQTCSGVCIYNDAASEKWGKCKFAETGNYERGIAKGYDLLFADRSEEDLSHCKKISVKQIYKEKELRIRPHHLMCMACHHRGRDSKDLNPIEADNIIEVLNVCINTPDIPIRLIKGPCMVCTPCRGYHEAEKLCDRSPGISVRDQKKDLDFLRLTGLSYNDVLPAREMFQKIFENILSTTDVCGNGDSIETGTGWRICNGPTGNKSYIKAISAKLGLKRK